MPLPDLRDIAAEIAAGEAQVRGLKPGCEKRIEWFGEPGVKTPLVVVFVHGFSASGRELSPMPERVAQALGANFYATRLTGHGQDGAALGEATLADWQRDVDEALEIAQALGSEVIAIGCSTGATLLTLALAKGARLRGVAMVSPNFGLRVRLLQGLLDLPGIEQYGDKLVGAERSFTPESEAHATYWTTRYPTRAVYTVGETVRAARAVDVAALTTPALFIVNDGDMVINPKKARAIADRWGGPVSYHVPKLEASDDIHGHILCGDVKSPGQTDGMVQRIIDWTGTL